MKQSIRYGAILLLILIGTGALCLAFTVSRLLITGYPLRTIILPSDFIGHAFIVEDPDRGVHLKTRGLWHREVTVRIPPTGVLLVHSFEPFTWMTQERIILENATVLDGTGSWGRRPSRVWEFGYTSRGSLPPTHPLHRYCRPDGSIRYIEIQIAEEPQFDPLKHNPPPPLE